MIRNRVILLVEDNPNDVELTLRAFEKSNVSNEIVVACDGEQAIQYLFKTGPHAGRDPKDMPEVVLLDMKLPKLDGLGVLRRMRADERTRRLPVVILTSSKEIRRRRKASGDLLARHERAAATWAAEGGRAMRWQLPG